jgi:predicted outer membrane repeat protein
VYVTTDFTAVDSTFSGNEAATGGALFLQSGGIDVTGSTFNDNAAEQGGALYVTGDTTFTNSTLTANSASVEGGAVYVAGNDYDITFESSTLVANSAPVASHVRAGGSPGVIRLWRSVVSSPLGGGTNCDLDGGSAAADEWWDSDETCMSVPGSTGDPMLGDLADNGGLTQTIAPLSGSPLIDAVSTCEPSVDQRGVARPQGAACDIGAVEALAPVTFTVQTQGGPVEVTVYEALEVDNVNATDTADLTSTPPAGLALPFGVFGFDIDVPSDGWSVTVELELPSPVTELWKEHSGSWDQLEGATFDGTTVTYGLTDGGTGDEDDAANSVIVDPVAPGVQGSFTG